MRIARITLVLLLGVLLVSAFACGGGLGAEPTPTPSGTHTWPFVEAGFFGRVLPPDYTGEVELDSLTDIPPQVQGVWWDDFGPYVDWPYWLHIVGPDGLASLTGQDNIYMVLVSGACEWEIPLP